MHGFPTYVALAALLIAGAAFVRVTPVPASEPSEPPVRRFTVDLRPVQEAWAWIRGRGERAVRREMAATSYYLQRIRDFADAVLGGSMSGAEAHDALMHGRYPSISTRCACAEQLSAYVHANVARVWVDDAWPARLAEYRAARGRAG
jgi:hypothetical protein